VRVLHLAADSGRGGGIAAWGEQFRAALRQAGVQVTTLEGRVGKDVTTSAYVKAALFESRTHDVVHVEIGGQCGPQFSAAGGIARRGHVPVCLTVHDPPRLLWRRWSSGSTVGRLTAGLASTAYQPRMHTVEHLVLARSRHLFVLTEGGASAMRERYGRAVPPVTVIPLPARPPAPAAPAPLRCDDGLVVGFHGYWNRNKGIVQLIDALARLRVGPIPIRARLFGDVLGAGDAGRSTLRYRTAVLREIHRRHVDDIVDVAGFVPADQLRAALCSCDVIVLPYRPLPPRWSGLASASAALHDALLAGVPVIGSDVHGLRDGIKPFDNGLLFQAGDVGGLVAALTVFRDNHALRERLRAGAQRASDEAMRRDVAEVTIPAYDAIVPRRFVPGQ
jgi:glycosyltransferase involved in cell wall biosynthesis